MGSGAYSVFIDQQAGGGPPAFRRVVPLPPPELSGAVKFSTVVLSLAYDNFGAAGAPEGQWNSRYAQRNNRSWAQMVSLFACG